MTKKPLELTIFPPVPVRPAKEQASMTAKIRVFGESLAWHSDRVLEHAMSQAKRLTDHELAAEFWHAAQVATYARGRLDWGLPGYSPITADRAEDIEHTLSRFAELPHYDQDEAQ